MRKQLSKVLTYTMSQHYSFYVITNNVKISVRESSLIMNNISKRFIVEN